MDEAKRIHGVSTRQVQIEEWYRLARAAGFILFALPDGRKGPPPAGWNQPGFEGLSAAEALVRLEVGNVGVGCGAGCSAVDADSAASAAVVAHRLGGRTTLSTVSPRGGHFLLAGDLAQTQSADPDVLDVRGPLAGYVVGPGSSVDEAAYAEGKAPPGYGPWHYEPGDVVEPLSVSLLAADGPESVCAASCGDFGAHPALRGQILKAVGTGAVRPPLGDLQRDEWARFLMEHGSTRRTWESARAEVDRMFEGAVAKYAPPVPRSAPRWEPPVLHKAPALPAAFPVRAGPGRTAWPSPQPTDHMMLAEGFVAAGECKGYLYLVEDNVWYRWIAGTGWRVDPGKSSLLVDVGQWAREHFFAPQRRGNKTVLAPDRIQGGKMALSRNVVAVLPAFEGVGRSVHDTERDPNLLGLPDAMCLDLRTGAVRAQSQSDLLVRACPVAPRPWQGTVFEKVVQHLFGDAAEVAQRLFGTVLWGRPVARIILVLPGVTLGGKTTFLKFLDACMGPYATTMKSDTLTTRATGDTSAFALENANAMLRGVRLAVMSELPRNRKLDPARINELTGGDALVSRVIGGNVLSMPPSHSIVFGMNDLARVDVAGSPETAAAMFQRMRVFRVGAAMDPALGQAAQGALRDPAELGAALQWLMDGAEAFRQHGELPLPSSMRTVMEDWWEDLAWSDTP